MVAVAVDIVMMLMVVVHRYIVTVLLETIDEDEGSDGRGGWGDVSEIQTVRKAVMHDNTVPSTCLGTRRSIANSTHFLRTTNTHTASVLMCRTILIAISTLCFLCVLCARWVRFMCSLCVWLFLSSFGSPALAVSMSSRCLHEPSSTGTLMGHA